MAHYQTGTHQFLHYLHDLALDSICLCCYLLCQLRHTTANIRQRKRRRVTWLLACCAAYQPTWKARSSDSRMVKSFLRSDTPCWQRPQQP